MQYLTRESRGASPATELSRVLLMISIVMIAVSMEPGGSTASGLTITIGLGLLIAGLLMPSGYWVVQRVFLPITLAVAAIFLLGAVASIAFAGVLTVAAMAIAGATGLWLLRTSGSMDEPNAWIVTALALVAVAVAAITALVTVDEPRIDVVFINEAGAEALLDGENPYVTVVVPDSSPIAEPGSTFTGYTYPPLALGALTASYWSTGDTRWINVLGVALFVLMVAGPWRRRQPGLSRLFLGGALVIALLPDLTFLLTYGWTDPIALPLLAGAALTWNRRPFAAAVLLGLALATKQYFVVLAPLVLVWSDDWRWRRSAVVGGAIGLTMLPVLVTNPQAFWDAAVAPALDAVSRPDSINAIALGIQSPDWLAPASALVVAVFLGRRGGGVGAFMGASAAVLGVAFYFGSQAFTNYWFLILSLVVLAFVFEGSPAVVADEPTPEPAAV